MEDMTTILSIGFLFLDIFSHTPDSNSQSSAYAADGIIVYNFPLYDMNIIA